MAVLVGAISYLRVRRFLAGTYDLGFYAQALVGIRNGTWFNTVAGFGVFSDHVSPLLVPLAFATPSRWTAESLVLLQSAVAAIGVFPAYAIGHRIGGRRLAVLTTAGYVSSAVVWHALLYDFHPVTLALPLGLWVVLELVRADQGRPWIPVLAMPLIREDVSLLYGLVVLIWGIRNRRRNSTLTGAAVAAIGLIYMAIMRSQEGVGSHLGAFGLGDPSDILGRPFRADSLVALSATFVPFLVVPVVKGWRLSWPGLALIAASVFSARPHHSSLYFQYLAQSVPFLIGGAAIGFSSGFWNTRIRLAMAATSAFLLILGPFIYLGYGPPDRYASTVLSSSDREQVRDLVAQIRPGASVSAGEMLTASVVSGPVFPFPGPMICGNSLLFYTPTTASVEYLLFEDAPSTLGRDWVQDLEDWGFVRRDRIVDVELWELERDLVPRGDCPSWDEQKEAARA
jgi:uncharacterized membrane protein